MFCSHLTDRRENTNWIRDLHKIKNRIYGMNQTKDQFPKSKTTAFILPLYHSAGFDRDFTCKMFLVLT